MVPDGWSVASLGEALDLMKNGTTAEQNTNGRGVPVTRIETISDGTIDLNRVRHLDRPVAELESFRLQYGDILLSHINSVKQIGKVAQYRGVPEYLVHGMNLMLLRPNRVKLDDLFGYYLLASRASKKHFESHAKQAVNQASLSQGNIASLRIHIPPLAEQRKIAAILSSVDEAIEKTQAVIDQVQLVKRGLMRELLSRGMPGRHTQLKQVKIGAIPVEWEVAPLDSLCSERPRYGANLAKAPFDPSGPRYVRITDIDEHGHLRADDKAGIAWQRARPYLLSEGDIVFARSGATVGKSYVYASSDGPCAHAGYLIRFRPMPSKLSVRFLGLVAQSSRYWQWVRESQRAQAQPNINANEYGSYLVPLPPLEEQESIVGVIASLNRRASREELSRDQLVVLKKSLMFVLLTGEIRVKVAAEAAP